MELAQVTFQQMESIMNTLVESTKIKKYDVGYIRNVVPKIWRRGWGERILRALTTHIWVYKYSLG